MMNYENCILKPIFCWKVVAKEGGVMDLDFQIANTYSLNVCN